MTRRNSVHKLLAPLCALVVAFVLVGVDLELLAQNSNSSTPTDPSAQNANTGRRGRRGRRTRSANTNTGTPEEATDANMNTNTSEAATPEPQAPVSPGTPGTEHDMTGTFTGTINAPDLGLSGPATVTFTTNTFTIDAGGTTQSGTYTAREWPGQVALSLRFGTTTPANIYSVRARHRGDSLTLTSVPGERKVFSFTTGGGGGTGGGRRRGRRRRAAPPPPTTDNTNNANMTPPPVN